MKSLCTSCHRYGESLWLEYSCRRRDAEKLYFVAACNIQVAAEPSNVRESESSSSVSAVTLWVTVALPVWVLTPSTLRNKHVVKDPLDTLLTTNINIQQFNVLPTECIYVFCVDLRTNSDYFPIQH